MQGITGREAVNLTRECLDYGAKIVGGVTPGRLGREVHGVPGVRHGRSRLSPTTAALVDGSVVTVPPAGTSDAVFEALRRYRAIVIVTERIPRRDVARWSSSPTRAGARIIGPNCLGVIVPGGAKMGGGGGRRRRCGLSARARSA